MSYLRVRHTITRGRMRDHTAGMASTEVAALAAWLTGGESLSMAEAAWCASDLPISADASVARWGLDDRNSRWQRDTAIDRDTVQRLKLKWAFAVPDASTMRSQPAVTADTLFLPTLTGHLFALDRESGCIKWVYEADAPFRTSPSLGRIGARQALFLGDQGKIVHAIDAATGEPIWRADVALFDASLLTGAPIPHGNRLYVPISAVDVALAMRPDYECCRSHGGIRALDIATGDIVWTWRPMEDAKPTYKSAVGTQMWGPSGAPVWTTPAIDTRRGVLYIGTGENTSSPPTDSSDAIFAIRLDSGEAVWSFQGTRDDAFNMACGRRNGPSCPPENGPDFDFGASVVLATNAEGDDIVLAAQKSGAVFALDPDREGALIWQRRIGPGSALGGVHWGIAADEGSVYVPVADPEFIREGREERQPGLWALDTATGADVWGHRAERGCEPPEGGFRGRQQEPWPDCPFRYEFSAAASIAGDVVFGATLNGHILAFDRADGAVLWQYDTVREYETVNGVPGHGGAIDSPGVMAAGDQLIAPSGYAMFGQMPGNVLLVFEVGTPPATAPRPVGTSHGNP